MSYKKLTDKQIDLEDSFHRFQMEKYGDVLAPGGGHDNENEKQEIEDRRNETKLLIENENLNNE